MKWTHLIAAALLAATGIARAGAVEIEHAQGTTVVPERPVRTAVFDLAILDHLQALGIDVAGVPDARFPADLEAAGEAPAKIGTLFEPDMDAVRQLDPDLIVVGGRSSKAYEALAAIAPTLDLGTSTDHFFEDALANLHTLGRIYGKPALAARRVGELRALRETVAGAAAGQTGLVLFTVRGRVMAHAPGARFGTVHDLLGLPSVLPSLDATEASAPRPVAGTPEAAAAQAQQASSLATALRAEPDWLIVLDRGLATAGDDAAATDLSAFPAITATRAWQAGRVLKLDPAAWYLVGSGYGVLRRTLEQFAGRLQAE